MAHYVGLDVSLEETSICVIDESGHKVWQGKFSSEPAAIAKRVMLHASEAVKVGFESGPLCTWHWHELQELGLPVVCLDARHAKAALSMQVNKTDANDAHGLAQIVRTGWYREVNVKSIDAHLIRTLLMAWPRLVKLRTKLSLLDACLDKKYRWMKALSGCAPFAPGRRVLPSLLAPNYFEPIKTEPTLKAQNTPAARPLQSSHSERNPLIIDHLFRKPTLMQDPR